MCTVYCLSTFFGMPDFVFVDGKARVNTESTDLSCIKLVGVESTNRASWNKVAASSSSLS